MTRVTLRHLDLSQRLLIAVVLLAVGGGYIAALANLFASDSGHDGKQTVKLEDFWQTLRDEGISGLKAKVDESLGKEDVIRKYHGSGETALEAALNGTMREKILEYYAGDEKSPDQATRDMAEGDRLLLIQWSKLEPDLRKKAYDEGVPMEKDKPNLSLLSKTSENLEPRITEILKEACLTCHTAGGDPQAKHAPLTTYAEVNRYSSINRGISVERLALTTHVHLLGFSVLFTMTGFMFSFTSYPWWVRVPLAPATLFLQVLEIACWWLGKVHVNYAVAIMYLGPLVGLTLLLQILGILVDICRSAPE